MNTLSFRDLQLGEPLLQALVTENFAIPTPIQAEAIPLVLSGHDVLGSAQTGSGKTAAFALPLLQLLSKERGRPAPGRPRALILAPTRELAAQIGGVFSVFSQNLRLSTAVIYGGVGKAPQVRSVRRGVDVAVATPGRLLDLMGDGEISLDRVKYMVLDEADRMLDMGFIPDVERIIRRLPEKRLSLFFSATLPEAIAALAHELLSDPVRIRVETDKAADPKIDQHVMFVNREDKRDALRMILTERGSYRALVFTRTKYRARDLCRYLVKNGISADDLHGDKSQGARTRALSGFHSGKIQVLVATDIASRGIDIDDIDHVINFELPNEPESYIHRIGRTARAGRAGVALSLCDESELDKLSTIQKVLSTPIPVDGDHRFHSAALAERATGRSRAGRGAAGSARTSARSGGHGRPANRDALHGGGRRGRHSSRTQRGDRRAGRYQ